MRKELNNIEKIELYLANQLCKEELQSFEKQINEDTILAKQVAEHQLLIQAIKRKQLRKEVLAVANGSNFWNIWTKLGLGLGIISILALSLLFLPKEKSKYSLKQIQSKNELVLKTSDSSQNILIKPTLLTQADSTEAEVFEQPNSPVNYKEDTECGGLKTFVEPKVQRFKVNAQEGTTIEGEQGTLVIIPPNAFTDSNGNTITSNVDFELVEALTLEDMILYNLTTTSNGKQLETGGMFYMNASQNGKVLKINPNAPIYTETPTNRVKKGMLAFDSEIDTNGNINWITPKPLKKYLTKIDLEELDFLPEGFANGVTNGLPYKSYKTANKDLIDSLYYALDEGNKNSEINTNLNEKVYLGNTDTTNQRKRKGLHLGIGPKISLGKKISTRFGGGSLKGKILLSDISEQNTCEITILNDNYNSLTFLTNNQGDFQIENIKTGSYNLLIQAENYFPIVIESIEIIKDQVTVLNDTTLILNTNNNQSRLIINTGTIKSEVLSEKENLVPNTRIQLSNSTYFYTTSTDDLGKFKIRNIPPGVYTLTASHSNFGNAIIDSLIIKPNKLLPLPLKLSRKTQLPNLAKTPKILNNESKKCGIRPLSIKTIKTSEFEQTYIATKEMEERIYQLHKLDNGDSLLSIYINNLGNDLYIADSLVANSLTGKNKAQFISFYNQKLTNLKDAKNIYQEQLSAYYTKKRKQYTKELKTLQKTLNQKETAELQQLSAKLIQNRIDYQKSLQQQQKKTQRSQSVNQTNKPKAISKHTINKIVNKIPKRSVASTPSYPAQWTSFGWKNIDQYTHLLANGYETVEIKTTQPKGFNRVFQYLNTIKTVTPLLNKNNIAKANFPKKGTKEARDMKSTYAFSLSKHNGKYFWGKVFYNPYTETTVKIEEKETSLTVIRNELRHAGKEGAQAIKYFEKQLKTVIENKKNAERNKQRLLEEKRKREQLFKEFTAKQAKLKAEIERKRQEQLAEENFMNQLRGIAFPCYKIDVSFESELIEAEDSNTSEDWGDIISQDRTYSFLMTEQKPVFPGGEITLMKYLSENVVYPQEAIDQELSGRVLVDFTIDIDGKIIDTKINKSVHPLLDKEALRTVSEMPDWSPGKIRGVNVKVSHIIPVSFKLNN